MWGYRGTITEVGPLGSKTHTTRNETNTHTLTAAANTTCLPFRLGQVWSLENSCGNLLHQQQNAGADGIKRASVVPLWLRSIASVTGTEMALF